MQLRSLVSGAQSNSKSSDAMSPLSISILSDLSKNQNIRQDKSMSTGNSVKKPTTDSSFAGLVKRNGVMGVPITILDKYCPEQFVIIGLGTSRELYTPNKTYINPRKHFTDGRVVSANEINSTLAYQISKSQIKSVYYVADNVDGYLFQPYARILIRRIKAI